MPSNFQCKNAIQRSRNSQSSYLLEINSVIGFCEHVHSEVNLPLCEHVHSTKIIRKNSSILITKNGRKIEPMTKRIILFCAVILLSTTAFAQTPKNKVSPSPDPDGPRVPKWLAQQNAERDQRMAIIKDLLKDWDRWNELLN